MLVHTTKVMKRMKRMKRMKELIVTIAIIINCFILPNVIFKGCLFCNPNTRTSQCFSNSCNAY